jgi:hypothetical protein
MFTSASLILASDLQIDSAHSDAAFVLEEYLKDMDNRLDLTNGIVGYYDTIEASEGRLQEYEIIREQLATMIRIQRLCALGSSRYLFSF